MSVFDAFTDITLNFSDLIGTTIFNEKKQKLGILKDFFVDYEEVYPGVLALQLKKNKQFFYIRWDDIKSFSTQKIIIKNDAQIGRSRTFPKVFNKRVVTNLLASQFSGTTIEYPPLGKIVLDKQIVDTHGKKVVRVNDIQFIRIGQTIRVTHAEIGLRSLIRRLGYESFIDFFVKLINPNSRYLTGNVLINWKYVHAIPDKTVQANVKLNLSNDDLKTLHPADLADILEDLDSHGRELIFRTLDPEFAAETLSEIDPDLQPHILKNENPERAADIIENMGTDEAADILDDLSDEKREDIIQRIDDEEIQEEIKELLEYDENTAGGLMSTEVFEVFPGYSKEKIMKIIQEEHDDIESIYDLYIVDNQQKLLGTCSLNRLLIQKENINVGDIMNSHDIKSLEPNIHWKKLSSYMSKYNLLNVPIVDKTNKLLGIVSVDDILPWLLDER